MMFHHFLRIETRCQDLASQLISSLQEGKISLALGGGRRNFQTAEAGGVRVDRDLLQELREAGGTVLHTLDDLQRWDYSDNTLGLFSSSHMEWEMFRTKEDVVKEPSLTEMTRQAITKLARSEAGFVLMVEGGRIDHAHHKNQAKRALVETLELERAVEEALRMTRREETLIIVTADHSHAITMNGYPDRGNPILGLNMDLAKGYYMALDDQSEPQPYTTISYANGPGFDYHYNKTTGFWRNLSSVDTQADDYMMMSTFHLSYETHGGEDVSAYAIGPQAHLLSGVHEQSYLAHLMAYAACLRPGDLPCPSSAYSSHQLAAWLTVVGLIINRSL